MVKIADLRKQREIERAWRERDPRQQAMVPWPIKCRIDEFRKSLIKPAAVVEAHLAKPDVLIAPALLDRRGPRQAALAKLKATLKGARIDGGKDYLEIRWLEPHAHLLQDIRRRGEKQQCILVHLAICHKETFGAVSIWQSWLTETPMHALGRLLERAPKTNLHDALFTVAKQFAAADVNQVTNNLHCTYHTPTARLGPML
jgi:hypothetical protein